MQQQGEPSFREILSRYKKARPDYQILADYLQETLRTLAYSLGIYPIVLGRAKSLESFAEKIFRPGKHFADPLREMTDLCGVRVIVHTLDEVEALAEAVAREFCIDQVGTEDKKARLAYREFGYLSTHITLQLSEVPEIAGCSLARRRRLRDLKAELQLRTLAQHLWADVYHELGYKNEFQLPAHWKREFHRLAAVLEGCDKEFQDIKSAMAAYESSYSSFLSQEELARLAERLEGLLAVDQGNVWAMHRLVRTYLSLEGADERLAGALRRYRRKVQAYAPALRDLGAATCQIHRRNPASRAFRAGQVLLEQAVARTPCDVDAWCSLAGTYRKQKKHAEALRCYREGYHLDPTNPYALGNYIAEELHLKSDVGILAFFRHAIRGAMDRCRKQIEIKVNLPWALFDLGIFHLYLGDPYAALGFYAKGIELAPRDWMVQTAGKTVGGLLEKQLPLTGLDVLERLLHLGWWIKTSEDERKKAAGALARGQVRFEGPVLILAGGCDGLEASAKSKLRELAKQLEGFRGTIVGGGTRSGVAAIPGALQARWNRRASERRAGRGALQTVGYLPAKDAEGVRGRIDKRYRHLRHTTGADFSPLEPLAFWEDFLASGGDPNSMRLLGFNGGKIAASEYRIALALGAQVGIIAGSGRAADELLADPQWKQHECLHGLNLSGNDVMRFLGG